MQKVNYGIIGDGFVADIHLNAIKHLRDSRVEVIGAAARDRDKLKRFAERHQIPSIYTDWRELVRQKRLDVVDICTPTGLHQIMIKEAASLGKAIICEKPLSGYFGEDLAVEQVGREVSRETMYKEITRKTDSIKEVLQENNTRFMYAENWVYAPPYRKMLNLLRQNGGVILDIRAEESHSGSHADYSRRWKTSGGGTLLRLGAHPVAGVIQLKYLEGLWRGQGPIRPKSVTGEVGYNSQLPAVKEESLAYLVRDWVDVEDWATAIIKFTDGTSAVVTASDGVLGGVRNEMKVFGTGAVVNIDMSQNNTVTAFAPVDELFGDEYITEKIETTAGWSRPSPDEDWMRGYPAEMEDFIDCLLNDCRPQSGWYLAEETLKVIYAAYLAAEKGQRMML